MKSSSESVASIRDSIYRAEKTLIEDPGYSGDPHRLSGEAREIIEYYVERAFVQTLVFLEVHHLNQTYTAVEQLNQAAKKDYSEHRPGPEDEYLVWTDRLRMYLDAIEATMGDRGITTVTNKLIDILKATQYAITDTSCFDTLPVEEKDVHRRIEAVLRCLFPGGVLHKPGISKPIKNFEPDTGLPSVRTPIEYKFITNETDAKRIAGEILADTRGYTSKEWDQFVYLIYETSRIKSEQEWNEMMRASEVGENTRVVVISGVSPVPPPQRRIRGKKLSH